MTTAVAAMQQPGTATGALSGEVAALSTLTLLSALPVRGLAVSTSTVSTASVGAAGLSTTGFSATAVSTAVAALVEHTTAPAMGPGTALRATARGHGHSHEEHQATENRFHRRESLTDRVENHLLGGRAPPRKGEDSHRPIKAMFHRPDPGDESAEDIACSWQRSPAGLISCIV